MDFLLNIASTRQNNLFDKKKVWLCLTREANYLWTGINKILIISFTWESENKEKILQKKSQLVVNYFEVESYVLFIHLRFY